MILPLRPPFAPMEALSVDSIPVGGAWRYEPKWDGFRCLAFRDGTKIELQSKSGRSMSRYFPELTAALGKLKPKMFVLDGEIVVPADGAFSFDALTAEPILVGQDRYERVTCLACKQLHLVNISTGEVLAETRPAQQNSG